MDQEHPATSISALRVHQWLTEWDSIDFDDAQNQAKPKEHFYLFSLPASRLRALAGIYRRSTEDLTRRKDDLGIQRKHDPGRSQEIRRYVEGGYPWSSLSDAKRRSVDNDKLKKPGWLPTAIVVNMLVVGDSRNSLEATQDDVITVDDDSETNAAMLTLPQTNTGGSATIPPIEIIDGQHRLFAFDENEVDGNEYELPVVAFHGLDISWQAYLFWVINIKPKRINPSLAFDLYPLLREQEWLDRGEVVHVYRDSRAQELTEILWSTPDNPWYQRINMLGGPRKENGPVTQASFIRSLVASMVKSWRSQGIFGGTPNTAEGLAWSRLQQSAFLVTAWQLLASRIKETDEEWTRALRNAPVHESEQKSNSSIYVEQAFTSANSLLATDQGVRAFLHVLNDLCFGQHQDLGLSEWRDLTDFSDVTPESVMAAAETLKSEPVYGFLNDLCQSLASFDWRTSAASGLSPQERTVKMALRGSGGYKQLRIQLVAHLREAQLQSIALAAQQLKS